MTSAQRGRGVGQKVTIAMIGCMSVTVTGGNQNHDDSADVIFEHLLSGSGDGKGILGKAL